MTTERPTNPADPTAERTTDQTTQTASGISADPELPPDTDDHVIAREGQDPHGTPRRDEGDTDDPVMPADDATLGTKI